MAIKHVIWDWNGTLLNDLEIVTDLTNIGLKARGHSPTTPDEFRSVFRHPVKEIYSALGCHMEDEEYRTLAQEFHIGYGSLFPQMSLFDDAEPALARVRDMDISQSILSAFPAAKLVSFIETTGLAEFFSEIIGLPDQEAHSKVEIAMEHFSNLPHEAEETLIIGDTDHDFEVAREIGAMCILISGGYQPIERLRDCGVPVVDSRGEAIELLLSSI